jgi:ABC-type antimicrobial peptide transport system permease subunit
MSFKYLIKLSLRTFITRPARTFLTILAMGVGISAILIFVSLGYGLQKTMLEQITTEEALLTLDISFPSSEVLTLTKEKISEISKIENVEEVSPLAFFPGQITLENLTGDTTFNICPPSYFRLGGIVVKFGKVFENEKERKVVISSALAKSFNLEEEKAIGKQVKINLFLIKTTETGEEKTEIFEIKEPYTISGVIEDDTTSYVYVPIQTLENLNIEEFSSAKVKVKDGKFLKQVSEKLINMGFIVSSLSETVEEANKVFKAIQITLGIFGIVALIVAAIGMANTMTVSLLERTNEIGIMKAIGASDRDIENMFLFEAVVISLLGGLGGILLNFGVSKFLNALVNTLAKALGGQPVTLFYTPLWFLIFIIVFSVLVGIFSGIFPARRGAKMDPLEALRYK